MEKSLDELLQAIANGGDVPVTTMREIKGLAETMGSLVSQMKEPSGPTRPQHRFGRQPRPARQPASGLHPAGVRQRQEPARAHPHPAQRPGPQPPAAKQTDPQLLEEGDEDLIDDDGHDGHRATMPTVIPVFRAQNYCHLPPKRIDNHLYSPYLARKVEVVWTTCLIWKKPGRS